MKFKDIPIGHIFESYSVIRNKEYAMTFLKISSIEAFCKNTKLLVSFRVEMDTEFNCLGEWK